MYAKGEILKKKEKTALSAVWNVVSTALVVIVVILATLLVGVRIFGLQPFCILSGSMEPNYPVGALVYVKKVDPSEIKVDDPITFVLNENLDVATHRVVRIDPEKEQFYTKGDVNESEDGEPVHFKNLIGKPVFSIPYLGYVSNYISTPPGMYVGIAGALILLILSFVPDIIKKIDDKEYKKLGDKKKEAIEDMGDSPDA